MLIFEEYHFDLNELVKVKEAVGIDPTPSALAQPHSHGRSLGTDWCGNDKPATGQHTLPRGVFTWSSVNGANPRCRDDPDGILASHKRL